MIESVAPSAAGQAGHSVTARPLPSEGISFRGIPITELNVFPPPPEARCWAYLTLNAEIALLHPRSPVFQALLRSRRAKVSVDGQWLWWALLKKYQGLAMTKMSGSDLIHQLAEHCAQEHRRLLLLGASTRSNALAVATLQRRWPGLEVAGFSPPHHAPGTPGEGEMHAEAIRAIRAFDADYVVLGLGCEKEMRFANATLHQLDGQVVGLLCFGGAIDLAGGLVKRAPRAWQRIGLEGLYRVWQQPSRLSRLFGVMRVLPLLVKGDY
jgi:N-acetylglucosaminyldiphosphoundecaprenol N-acetyl-beta-D-mannosaminyltransferase